MKVESIFKFAMFIVQVEEGLLREGGLG